MKYLLVSVVVLIHLNQNNLFCRTKWKKQVAARLKIIPGGPSMWPQTALNNHPGTSMWSPFNFSSFQPQTRPSLFSAAGIQSLTLQQQLAAYPPAFLGGTVGCLGSK